MPRREEKEIPIKIGGWDGKFRYEKPTLKEGYVLVSHRRTRSNLHTQDQRPKTPPPQHYRKNSGASSDNEDQSECNNPNLFRDQHHSNTNNFYGFSTEPEILPTTWSGKFQLDPNDVRIKQERNQSDVRDYADHRNFVVRNNN
ncbi:hypothetical protein HA402_011729 [Bradysia odoriphaga]|nr:hypothetical protein HA402_011729 [Bradysia odoriphaga]